MNTSLIINLVYVISTLLFILGLKNLGSPATARRGNLLSSVGMLLAILITLIDKNIITYQWILLGLVTGSIIGAVMARIVAMTAMPEMVAILNGLGGISSLFVGCSAYLLNPSFGVFTGVTIAASVFIGGVTCTGSLVAWAKLRGLVSKPLQFAGQQFFNSALLIGIFFCSYMLLQNPVENVQYFYFLSALSLIMGVMAVVPIGGADMPVVISLLNSYSGMAACSAGFVMNNNLLIVAGALVGASGIILTQIMCKAMNRSLGHVLFSGFGAAKASQKEVTGETNPINVEDTHLILEAATNVCIVPGYGLAVAQAQHAVRELAEILEDNGAEVRFAIHPVAGRMPGHMNVLLAEANVDYENLHEMDEVNPIMENIDVCIVIGANDVVNPAAREEESSPIYGMPVINVDQAKTVIVLKRGMASGFAGIQNPLFYKSNTRMLFGDAKSSVQGLVSEFKQ
jgi:H+-translocating NAD(P) transhydrogenase subunit beta